MTPSQSLLELAEAERDEADRRAGAAERKLADLQESSTARAQWLAKAKRDAGYADAVSFDIVWAAALAALNEKRALSNSPEEKE